VTEGRSLSCPVGASPGVGGTTASTADAHADTRVPARFCQAAAADGVGAGGNGLSAGCVPAPDGGGSSNELVRGDGLAPPPAAVEAQLRGCVVAERSPTEARPDDSSTWLDLELSDSEPSTSPFIVSRCGGSPEEQQQQQQNRFYLPVSHQQQEQQGGKTLKDFCNLSDTSAGANDGNADPGQPPKAAVGLDRWTSAGTLPKPPMCEATVAKDSAGIEPLRPFAWLKALPREQRRRLRGCRSPHAAQAVLSHTLGADRAVAAVAAPGGILMPVPPAGLADDLCRHTQAAQRCALDLEEQLLRQAAAHESELAMLRDDHRRACRRAKLQLLAQWAPHRSAALEAIACEAEPALLPLGAALACTGGTFRSGHTRRHAHPPGTPPSTPAGTFRSGVAGRDVFVGNSCSPGGSGSEVGGSGRGDSMHRWRWAPL